MHQSDLRWIQACVPQSPQGACMPGMCWGQVPSYFHTYNLVPQLLSSPTWNPKHPSWSLSSPDMFKPVSPILPPEPERHDQEKKFRKAPRIPKMDTCHCILSHPLLAYGLYEADPTGSNGCTSPRPRRPDASSSWSVMKHAA